MSILFSSIASRGGWFGLTLVLICTLASAEVAAQIDSDTDVSCTRDTGPTGITAASWSDATQARAALARPGFNKISFVTRDGKHLVAHIYRPSRFDPANGPIWFVMHGIKRNADYYVETAAPVAERYQALTIVIEFSRRYYPASEDYTLGITTRGHANTRAAREGRYLKPDAYLYNEIERVFEAIRLTLDGKQRGYYLFGHSAGAQFTHRMLTFVPCARVLSAVAANAGWYTLPIVDNRKHFGMPYSLRGNPSKGTDLKALLSAPLILLLGTHDIKGPDADRNVRKNPATMAQGPHRLARGHHYFETGQSLARSLNTPFAWQLFLAPGAEHDVQQVIASAGHLLFAAKEPVCVSSTADEANQLVFHEIMVNPPAGNTNDASRDGTFHAGREKFIEIVNAGNTPICLEGWTLEGIKWHKGHLFSLDRALVPGKALVVFSGGIPTNKSGGTILQRSTSTKGINLDHDGDILTMRDANSTTVKQLSWGHCGGMTCNADHWRGSLPLKSSLVRWPNPDGQWQVHGQISNIPMSPGLKSNGDVW